MYDNGWEQKLISGSKAENTVLTWLNNNFKSDFISVTTDKKYQDIDVDFLCNGEYKLELKSDARIGQTGNVFFEVGFKRQTGYRPGWYSITKCDYLLEFDWLQGDLYFIKFDDTLQQYIHDNANQITYYNKPDNCIGYAYILSINQIRRLGKIAKEVNIYYDGNAVPRVI